MPLELTDIEKTKAKNIARDATILGIEGLITHNIEQLEEIERLDLELGEVCAEARRAGAQRLLRELRIKRAARGLRTKLLEEMGSTNGH